jgi:hypothetical protein
MGNQGAAVSSPPSIKLGGLETAAPCNLPRHAFGVTQCTISGTNINPLATDKHR